VFSNPRAAYHVTVFHTSHPHDPRVDATQQQQALPGTNSGSTAVAAAGTTSDASSAKPQQGSGTGAVHIVATSGSAATTPPAAAAGGGNGSVSSSSSSSRAGEGVDWDAVLGREQEAMRRLVAALPAPQLEVRRGGQVGWQGGGRQGGQNGGQESCCYRHQGGHEPWAVRGLALHTAGLRSPIAHPIHPTSLPPPSLCHCPPCPSFYHPQVCRVVLASSGTLLLTWTDPTGAVAALRQGLHAAFPGATHKQVRSWGVGGEGEGLGSCCDLQHVGQQVI
jgi:hypothetical protein